MAGWVKIHRKILSKGWFVKSDYLHLWVYLLLKANHDDNEWLYKDKLMKVKRGQFVTSRNTIVRETGINRSKVERILKCFENEQQIEQQNLFTSRLITIINYDEYQISEQQNEQQVSSKRAASEQQVSTNKNDKNEKNEKNKETYVQKADEFHQKWNRFAQEYDLPQVRALTDKRKKYIKAKLRDKSFDFDAILEKISKSDFLLGRSERGFQVTFDWIFQYRDNYIKILEGNYENKVNPGNGKLLTFDWD